MKCEQPGAAAVSTLAAAAAPQLAQTSEQKAAVGLQRPSVVLKLRQHVPPHNCGCSGQPLALGVVALVGALLMVLLQMLGVVL